MYATSLNHIYAIIIVVARPFHRVCVHIGKENDCVFVSTRICNRIISFLKMKSGDLTPVNGRKCGSNFAVLSRGVYVCACVVEVKCVCGVCRCGGGGR